VNIQAYSAAMEQRLALRRDLKERLQQIRETAAQLGAAAGDLSDARPSSSATGLPADPLARIEPLCAVAAALAGHLRSNQSDIAALEQAIAAARRGARRDTVVRAAALAAGALIGVGVIVLR
jgi:hypothetical protein